MKGSFFRDAIFMILAASAIGLIYNNFAPESISLWREKAEMVEVSDDELLRKLGGGVSGQTTDGTEQNPDKQTAGESELPDASAPESSESNATAPDGSKPEERPTDANAASHSEENAAVANEQAPATQESAKPATQTQDGQAAAAEPAAEELGEDSGPIKNLKYAQVAKMVDNDRVQFIDARKADEFQAGKIGNAVNIHTPEHEEHLPMMLAWPRDKLYVVYCGGGNCDLSNELAEIMMGFGFEDVYVYKGGYTEWTAEQGK